jgi:hypothetical protein
MISSRFAHPILAFTFLLPWPALAGLLVTDVSGLAEVDGRGRVVLMAELPDGTALNIAPGARVVAIDLGSGREFVLTAGRYAVEKSGPSEVGGKAVASSALPAGKLPAVKIATGKVAQATLVMRSARKSLAGLSPNQTAVSTTRPTLRWPDNADATGYRVTLNDAGGRTVFDSTLPKTNVVLSASEGLQAGGRYTWRVEAVREGRTLAEHRGEFSVLGATDIYRLGQFRPGEGAEFSRRTLYAALLMEAGAIEEARSIWQALRAERPDDPALAKLAE